MEDLSAVIGACPAMSISKGEFNSFGCDPEVSYFKRRELKGTLQNWFLLIKQLLVV